MKKRCQIATVLANSPEVLLMDEPFGALDYPTKCQLQEQLLNILAREPKATVFVTHDIEEALFLADRVVVMGKGAIRRIVDVPFPEAAGGRSSNRCGIRGEKSRTVATARGLAFRRRKNSRCLNRPI